jgi:RND superfamily putative drug exporter
VVIIADEARADATLAAVTATSGIDSASLYAGTVRPGAQSAPLVESGRVLINAVLTSEADSAAAEDVVRELRAELPKTAVGKLSKKELVDEEARKREPAKA